MVKTLTSRTKVRKGSKGEICEEEGGSKCQFAKDGNMTLFCTAPSSSCARFQLGVRGMNMSEIRTNTYTHNTNTHVERESRVCLEKPLISVLDTQTDRHLFSLTA